MCSTDLNGIFHRVSFRILCLEDLSSSQPSLKRTARMRYSYRKYLARDIGIHQMTLGLVMCFISLSGLVTEFV